MPLQTLLHTGTPINTSCSPPARPIAEGWLRSSPYKPAPPTDSVGSSAAASPRAMGDTGQANEADADDLRGHSMLETAADYEDECGDKDDSGADEAEDGDGGDARAARAPDASVRVTGAKAEGKGGKGKKARQATMPRYKPPPVKQVPCCLSACAWLLRWGRLPALCVFLMSGQLP